MTLTDPFPKLTPVPMTGTLTCGYYCATPDTSCDQPATWHIAWTLTPPRAKLSLVCDACLLLVQQQWVYTDLHPTRPECDLPGTGWCTSSPSRCVWLAATEETPDA